MKEKQLKTEAVRTRLNPEEKAALKRVAENNNMTVSRLIQKLVRETINKEVDLSPKEMAAFKDAIRQLAAIGTNLNQLTRAVNSGKCPGRLSHTSYWEDLKLQVTQIRDELDRYIDATENRWVIGNG